MRTGTTRRLPSGLRPVPGLRPAAGLLLAVVAIPACGRWEDHSDKVAPVWSDDGTEIGYIQTDYQFKPNFIVSGGDYRDQRYQLRTLDPETDTDEALSPTFNGDPLTLTYMRTAGYLVVGTEGGPYDVVDRSGNVLESFEPRDAKACPRDQRSFQRFEVLPSLDGSVLAVVETREDCTITVEFRDGPPGFARTAAYSIDALDFDAVAWTRSGRLLVSTCSDTCGDGRWLVDPASGPDSLPEAGNGYGPCFFVPTSSSFVRADGTAVWLDYDFAEVLTGPISADPDWDGYTVTADDYTPGCAQLDDG